MTGPGAQEQQEPGPTPRRKPWTAERVAVLQRDYPAGRPLSELRQELNTMPGAPLSGGQIGVRAAYLGLKRPGRAALAAMPPSAVVKPPPAEAPVQRPQPSGPIVTDLDTVRHWGAQRGVAPQGRDIAEVNAKRAQLGLQPFELEVPALRKPFPTHTAGA